MPAPHRSLCSQKCTKIYLKCTKNERDRKGKGTEGRGSGMEEGRQEMGRKLSARRKGKDDFHLTLF